MVNFSECALYTHKETMKTDRIDIRIEKELKDFVMIYASLNHTTVSKLFVDFIIGLRINHTSEIQKHKRELGINFE